MPDIRLIDVDLPEFGVPDVRPELSAEIYAGVSTGCGIGRGPRVSTRSSYADREHFANMAYLTGFDPRFEEALLVLAGGRNPIVVTGPENQGYAPVSPLDLELVLYPPFGLLGQDRPEDAAARRNP